MFRMPESDTPNARGSDQPPADPQTLDQLSRALADLVRSGSPAISRCANWMLHHPQEIAFHSIRALAERADVNVNAVYRTALALGFSGFEPCRAAFQAALRHGGVYGARAERLRSAAGGMLSDSIRASAHQNIESLFAAETLGRIDRAVDRLLAARRIYCVGARSCFSLAHYIAYTGRMAFGQFAPCALEPGAMIDTLSEAGPQDVVIAITFSHYSVEVVSAHGVAAQRGAQIIAITDSFAAPIAAGAAEVFTLPMAGPQTLPSLAAAFTLAEVMVSEMIARSDGASDRVSAFETRILEHGGYVR